MKTLYTATFFTAAAEAPKSKLQITRTHNCQQVTQTHCSSLTSLHRHPYVYTQVSGKYASKPRVWRH